MKTEGEVDRPANHLSLLFIRVWFGTLENQLRIHASKWIKLNYFTISAGNDDWRAKFFSPAQMNKFYI